MHEHIGVEFICPGCHKTYCIKCAKEHLSCK